MQQVSVMPLYIQEPAPKLWNAPPRELRDIPYLHTFKRHLKTHLFKFPYS